MARLDELATEGRGSNDSLVGCFARLFWMAIGNIALILVAIGILRKPAWTFSWLDAAFWAVVLGVLGVRYLEVTRLGGLDVDGKPVTRRTLMRYAIGVGSTGAVLWCAVQSIGL